ncbi:MAG: WbqC family protein [Bacteroidia bacterium]|nr:WbqC family protein [Bacteroidia bacterium]MDW8159156.1 WbqC family protein [Bacteroidia bacterium]
MQTCLQEEELGNSLILPPTYLPSISWYAMLLKTQNYKLGIPAKFIKQSLLNRAYIKGANKLEPLIIPIRHATKYCSEVEICFNSPWHLIHQKALQSAYGRAAYFLYYSEPLLSSLEHPPQKLYDFNLKLIQQINAFLKLPPVECIITTDKIDLECVFHFPQGPYPDYFQPPRYWQPFGKFIPNLSILDLLFHTGPEAILFLRKSITYPKNI